MIIVVVLLVLIFRENKVSQDKIKNALVYTKDSVVSVLKVYCSNKRKSFPSFYMIADTESSLAPGNIIHIAITKSDGSIYSNGDLAKSGLHEIAHMLNGPKRRGVDDHDISFMRIYNDLLKIAVNIGVLDR